MQAEPIEVSAGGLTLNGTLAIPPGSERPPGVLVLGAHPKYGGERRGDVAARMSDALLATGLAALRIDYRGDPDRGRGETEDAVAALSALARDERVDGSRLGAAGYAFGASVALGAARDGAPVQAVAAAACPLSALTEAASAEILAPKLIVGAGQDHDLPVDQFRFLSKRLSEPTEVAVIEDADHFFTDHLPDLCDVLSSFFRRTLLRKA